MPRLMRIKGIMFLAIRSFSGFYFLRLANEWAYSNLGSFEPILKFDLIYRLFSDLDYEIFYSLGYHLLTGRGGSNHVFFNWLKFVEPANLKSIRDYLLEISDI